MEIHYEIIQIFHSKSEMLSYKAIYLIIVSFPLQIGHEPLPFYETRTFTGRPILAYPSVFRYGKEFKKLF